MNENLDHRLDERLRTALHDLDRRIDQRLAPRTDLGAEPGAELGTEPSPELGTDLRAQTDPSGRTHRRSPRLVPALAGFAVIALLVTIGWLSGSLLGLVRDLLLARLSVSRRVALSEPISRGSTTRITASEGTWVISGPDMATLGDPDTSCLVRKGKGPSDHAPVMVDLDL